MKRSMLKNSEHLKLSNPTITMNLNAIDNSFTSKIEIELHENISPLSSENFKQLCLGSHLKGGKKLSYEGLKMRVDSKKVLLSSDYVTDNIYNTQKLLHENYESNYTFKIF